MEDDERLILEELGADGRPVGVESDNAESEETEPFDPEKISIEPKVVSMDTLIRRLLQGTIRLAPAFQRKLIWDIRRKSQLIESLMLNIPIPMFYISSTEKGVWDVVDGLQRLSTIREFILGDDFIETNDDSLRGEGFRLKGLEFWGDKYNGNTFNDLPNYQKNRILETEFRFTIINPGTPEIVKRNVFKRINTGGLPLTSQEIRHALYQGRATTLLEELADSDVFLQATSGSVNDSRMAARELILRFLAFSIHDLKDYPKNSDMDGFLSNTMRVINVFSELRIADLKKIYLNSSIPEFKVSDVEDLKLRFSVGMDRSFKLFMGHCFRKSFGLNRRSPINKSLFEVWGNLMADLDDKKFKILERNKNDFLTEYHNMFENPSFVYLISRDSWKYSGVQERYKILGNLVNIYTENPEV